MKDIVIMIWNILFYPCLFFSCYYVLLSIVGLIFHKQKYPMREDKLKYCIFVPCHNEETVIGATVENLAKINYNQELFDIYFIADNCADQTAKKTREAIESLGMKNFHSLERFESDKKKRGKPHAMRWGIDLLENNGGFYQKYDMFMVFDADNFVDADILKHMNSQYLSYPEKKRPVMIQAYLDSKNKNNLIARGYYVAYRMTNGFLQLPKSKLGLVPGIGGTGFAASTEFLQSIGGYNCSSLVEDLEFETIATLHGKTIAYNHNVRIYDEKPTGLVQSAVQKTRWCQGHWYVFFKYSWRLFFKMLNPKEFRLFFKRLDSIIHLSSLVFMLFATLATFYPIVLHLCNVTVPDSTLLGISSAMFVISILIFPISSLYDGKKEERRRVLIDFIPNIIASIIMMLVYFYSNIVGLLHCKNQTVWKKTAHKVTSMNSPVEKSNNKSKKKETANV